MKKNDFKILIVDDEEDIVDMLITLLKKEYVVFGVNSSLEAIKKIEEKAFNLVVTDICMPDMDGLKLMRWIKKHNGSIQIIAMTGYTTLFNVIESHRIGANDLFFKPIKDFDAFLDVVKKIKQNLDRWRHLAAIAEKE